MLAHKIWAAIIIVAIIGTSYGVYAKMSAGATETQYTLSTAKIGTLTQTVSGTGQVSALNQLDITSKVSGMITSIPVSVGDSVKKGDLLATIDSTDAARTLENARISLAKLTEPAKAADIADATSNVTKAYDSGFNTVAGIFNDLPSIVTNMKDMLYGQNGFLSNQRSSFLSSTGREYRDTVGQKYDKAVDEYITTLATFRTLNRNSSQKDIDALLASTYAMVKDMADAVTSARNTVTFIITSQPTYSTSDASSAASSINAWSSTLNSDVANVLSSQNAIQTSTHTLNDLIAGTDSLDLQAGQLSFAQAQQTYENYFIRAPFDGIVGKINASVYGQAGSSALLTLVGNEKVSTISLNEIDAAKVKAGQSVTITFDAIDGLTATGTVSSVDLVGTVSSGVVTYNVKILINTHDDRIRPGMSLNATITTEQKSDILLVPSSAIKTRGSIHYVQVLTVPTTSNTSTRNKTATSTSSRTFSRTAGTAATRSTASITTTSVTDPIETIVTIGDADDTNTEILSGITEGQFVVTKTSTVSSGTTNSTTSGGLLSNLFGGPRQNTATRTTTGTRSTTNSTANTSATKTTTSGAGDTGAGGPPPGAF